MSLLTTLFLGSAVAFDLRKDGFALNTNSKAGVCDGGDLQSALKNLYYRDQYTGTDPGTHMKFTCQGATRSWSRSVAAPNDCVFANKNQCWNPNNNCIQSLSAQCDIWCRCVNHNSLGASSDLTERLGHSRHSCPNWLPQVQSQLQPGEVGYTCWQPNAYCSYPKHGMDFVCTGYGGYWKLLGSGNTCPHISQIWNGKRCYSRNQFCQYPTYGENYVCTNGKWALQGPAPTPKPVAPTTCPNWVSIWDGKTCYSNLMFCQYPTYGENFICTGGKWTLQGPAPTPPPTNSVHCPPAGSPPTAGNYCTSNGEVCDYGYQGKFMCNDNGVWKRA